uniref:Uncharacterized protein n=1 Tax=Mola mola TaxID=94237 RepID=A0A3Q3WU99_MOLML
MALVKSSENALALQFDFLDDPYSGENDFRRASVCCSPIVIERLLLLSEEQGDVNSAQSSISFTALSEERLHAAVQLAKRDLRRRRLESLTKSPTRVSQEGPLPEISGVERLQVNDIGYRSGKPGAKQSVLTSQKKPLSPITRICKLTQTRNPGPIQLEEDKQGSLSKEIHKLQHELEIYIQKVEELPNREEQVEPEEQNKLEIRRQKQAAHSAQIIYVLQQQVKQIQEDIENFRIQKIWDIKKSVAINRLAAVHRSTVRALRVIIHQLSDLSHDKVPAYWKELGKLIRQLSLCSAKVEVENGSAVPESALCILQKLEVRPVCPLDTHIPSLSSSTEVRVFVSVPSW